MVIASFWTWQLGLAMALNFVVQAIQIGAYASRLAGVQSGRVATSISLFNVFVTASRLAALIYTPMLGAISDRAAQAVREAVRLGDGTMVGALDTRLDWQLRLIVLAGTVGTAVGAALLPTFIMLFMRGIAAFERTGSLPGALARLADPRVLWQIAGSVRVPPPLGSLRRFEIRYVPRRLLYFNVVVTAIYAIGVVAAYYASVLNVDARGTAIGSSGLINGIATVSFTLFVDPTSAYIVDQAVKGERSLVEVKAMVFYLALTAVAGTLISQVLLYPAAVIIAAAAQVVNTGH